MREKPSFEVVQALIQREKPTNYEALDELLNSVGWTIPEYDAVPELPRPKPSSSK
jgi:hypothetical protein